MKWLLHRNTATKLMLAFGIVLVLAAIIAGVGLYETRQVRDDGETIGHTWLGSVRDAGNLHAMLWEHRGLGLRRVDEADSPEAERRLGLELDSLEAEFENGSKDFEKYLVTDEMRRAFGTAAQRWKEYLAEDRRVADLVRAGKVEEAHAAVLGSADEAAGAAGVAFDQVIELTTKGSQAALQHADEEYASARFWIIAVLLTALALGALLALTIARAISGPLGRAVATLNRVAEGDLTARLQVEGGDEVARMAAALNQALDAILSALRDVRDSADATSSSAQQLQSASEEISAGAQEQATSLEETAASLEQMTASVRQSADHARQADELAQGARNVAERGGQVVLEAVSAMGAISDASRQIAAIISTIDEIAFQTNILALNAAVEAARAGQQGRGFAVVAGEVRTLAQRSAAAAKEIKTLIQDSGQKVEVGQELVHRSGESLQEIVTAVKRVSDIVGDMAAASREQASGIDQVNRAIGQMDSVTQSNATQTEELASTAEALASQAEQLQALVSRFTVDDVARAQPSFRSAAPARRTGPGGGRAVPGHWTPATPTHQPSAQGRRRPALAGVHTNGATSGTDEPAELTGLDGFQEY